MPKQPIKNNFTFANLGGRIPPAPTAADTARMQTENRRRMTMAARKKPKALVKEPQGAKSASAMGLRSRRQMERDLGRRGLSGL